MSATATRQAAEPTVDRPGERTTAAAPAKPRALLLQRRCACGSGAGNSGECDSCAARPTLQRHDSGTATRHTATDTATLDAWPQTVDDTLARPGRTLDADTRGFMENRFGGRDFSAVRLHDDAAAAQSACDVDAHAYTVGQHIVFGAGQYQPGSDSGRHLLAHELAHTVQQQGLQRAGTAALADHGADYRRLEAEADRTADAVMRGGTLPPLSAGGQRLSRKGQPKRPGKGKAVEHEIESRYKDVEVTTQHKVRPEKTFAGAGADETLASFEVDRLDLHPSKGPVLKVWKGKAKGGGVRAIVTMNDTKAQQAGLWQTRAKTDELRERWVNKRGWKTGEALDAAWKKAGGSDEFPKVLDQGKEKTCQMDHVIELQLGGDNTQENIEPLDGNENGESGSRLNQQSFGLAESIARNMQAASEPLPAQIRLVFRDAAMTEGAADCGVCCKTAAKLGPPSKAGKADKTTQILVDYPLTAGGSTTTLRVPDKAKTAPIYESEVAENRTGAELIPGLLLATLHRGARGARKRQDSLHAMLDNRDKTRLPVTLPEKGSLLTLEVGDNNALKLSPAAKKDAGIAFTYDYLSPGRFTSIEAVANGVAAEGYITTTKLPFVKRLEVSYAPDHFRLKAPLDKSKLQPPFPGVSVTDAALAIDLAPTLKPVGYIAFEFGKTKKLAAARVEVGADSAGITFDGDLNVYLPGVDEAKGKVRYQGGQWTGNVHIESSAMAGKIPFVKGGAVDVTLTKNDLDAVGKLNLVLPGGNDAVVELRYRPGGWQFYGRGTFKTKSPYLKPIQAKLLYDGTLFTAEGEGGFTFAGLDGTMKALYEHRAGYEKITGEGTLNIDKGRAKGSVNVKLLPNQKVSGTGRLSYEIKKGMVATAGVTIDEQQKITFDGELALPDMTLFKRIPEKEETHTIFKASGSFPLPGASIGPLGIKIKLWGELGWYYHVGPGVLTGVKANVRFSPLEENPDFSFKLTAKASIPAAGGIYGKVGADAVLDALIAEAGAGLSVEARAGLEGKAELGGDINYAKDRFSVDAKASISGAIVLSASLNAHVYAEAGVWRFKVRTDKWWELASRRFPTDLKLGLSLPLHYDSVDGFRMPALSDIKREPEELKVDAADLFGRMLDSAPPTKEKEA